MKVGEQREILSRLVDRATAELDRLISPLPVDDIYQKREVLMDVLPLLGETYGEAAAALAADFYYLSREEAGVPGYFEPRVPPLPTADRWRTLSLWGTQSLIEGVGSDDLRTAAQNTLTRVSGGLKRSIFDQHRLTITDSSVADPQARGWRRVGDGKDCSFCRSLIAGGKIYTSPNVSFKSHDSCGCGAEMVWRDS